MKKHKALIIFGVIILVIAGGFYAYLSALASVWTLNKPDKRPFFIVPEPTVLKRVMLPKGTKIVYERQFFWEKYEQKEPLKEKDIVEVSFVNGATIDWGGVPITSMVKFYNSEMRGFSVYPDFSKLEDNQKTEFSSLWQSCDGDLGITVKKVEDWSFNKENILDVQSCSVSFQRYFTEDTKQQMFLDSLHVALMKIE
ncbi:MAG: hypothetical protein AAGF77_02915 [Bacteroidota bacterium]